MLPESRTIKAEHEEYLQNFRSGRAPDKSLDFGLVVVLALAFFIEFLLFFILMP